MTHLGIDFGSKRSGKTAVCYRRDDTWVFEQSRKDSDADAFVQALVRTLDAPALFIDAPLSLPAVLSGGAGKDYFYRKADREAKAMSPMFLGGLTARAIRLKDTWEAEGRNVYEAYPAGLVDHLEIRLNYKKDPGQFLNDLSAKTGLALPEPSNWHQADALLAWLTGKRVLEGNHLTLGDPGEGLICI